MNQLQPILAAIKKWGFWVICSLAVLIGLGVWFVAQQSVQASIKARKEQLEGLKSQVSGVQPGSPNAQVIEATKKKIEELKADVYQAWVSMYAAQKEKNKWPAALGQEFLNWVNQPGRKFGDPIPERFREIYLNFIDQHFPTLFEIINLRRPKGTDLKRLGSIRAMSGPGGYGMAGYGGSPGYPGAVSTVGEEGLGAGYPGTGYPGAAYPGATGAGAPAQVEMEGIVEWNPQNIAAIKQRFAWVKVPTSEEIWNAQEDLWVYEALLRIIAKTNEGATGPHNAAVKRINAIEIGPDAARYLASSVAAAMPTGSGSMGSPGSAPMGSGPVGPEAAGGEYGSGYGAPGTTLYGRYVDADGKPLPPGSPQPFAEFKMMPIRMDLVVDQRKLDQLLVNCVNSDMPIRITRVLVRPSQASMGQPGGPMGYGGMVNTMSESYGEETAGPGYATSSYGTGTPGATTTSATSNYDVPVIIEGIIYIFNPPNIEELGKPGAPELPSGQSLAQPPAEQGQPGATAPESAAPTQPGAGQQPATQPPTTPQAPAGAPQGPTPAPPGGAQPAAPAQGGAQPGGGTPPTQPPAPGNAGVPPNPAQPAPGGQGAAGNAPAQPLAPQPGTPPPAGPQNPANPPAAPPQT
ncbi:MAG: hypothetical protein H5U08_07705 [Thermogutta sp.]|uniref:hypothetical protein n=1 Tax=Thermogutta sp. TaxID=1962930 RepID=UPI0019C9ED12|nr:hypothetical protein [Thermogutta sp.]MBC7352228.1 hypothetical protein [Thermogutta sp.]